MHSFQRAGCWHGLWGQPLLLPAPKLEHVGRWLSYEQGDTCWTVPFSSLTCFVDTILKWNGVRNQTKKETLGSFVGVSSALMQMFCLLWLKRCWALQGRDHWAGSLVVVKINFYNNDNNRHGILKHDVTTDSHDLSAPTDCWTSLSTAGLQKKPALRHRPGFRYPGVENPTQPGNHCCTSNPAATTVALHPLKIWSWSGRRGRASVRHIAAGCWAFSLLSILSAAGHRDTISLQVLMLNVRFASTLAGLSLSSNDAIN